MWRVRRNLYRDLESDGYSFVAGSSNRQFPQSCGKVRSGDYFDESFAR